jgi:Mrp family chromosome partitioning ATPase
MSVAATGVDRIRRALQLQRSPGPSAPGSTLPGEGGIEARVAPPVREPAATAPRYTRHASVDAARLRRERILAPGDCGPAAQALKMLRTQVLHLMRRGGYRSLAVVSPTAQDGRTVTAINLAASIAGDPDHTALLVDLNFDRPGVHERFGISVTHGVEACLAGQAEVAEAMVRPEGFGDLALLPARRSVAGSAELLAADATRRFAREVNARYADRVVLYDLPPLLETADALAFLPCVDATLLVVRESRTRREDVVRSLQLMRETPVVGTVLNASRESRGL